MIIMEVSGDVSLKLTLHITLTKMYIKIFPNNITYKHILDKLFIMKHLQHEQNVQICTTDMAHYNTARARLRRGHPGLESWSLHK